MRRLAEEEAEKQEILRRKQHGVPLGRALVRSRMVWVYTSLMVVPAVIAYALVGGKTQMSKEDLMKTDTYKRLRHGKLALANEDDRKDRVDKINTVLFETKGEFRHEWARKREGGSS